MKTPIPTTILGWIAEIRLAQEAAMASPMFLVKAKGNVKKLYLLAPQAVMLARGLPLDDQRLKDQVLDAASASLAATLEETPELENFPTTCFAFVYLSCHLGLDLVSDAKAARIWDGILENTEALLAPVGAGPKLEKPPRRKR